MAEETRTTGMAGVVLDKRYRVGEVLGQGGMGSVYRGTDLVLGRDVALKIFRADVANPEELGRQQSEAQMLAGLNHPGLVTLFDTGTLMSRQREVPFLVMELVSGTDLRRHLATGPLPGADAARLGAKVAEALHYIHHRGVVHRDVKPANILLARYSADSPLRPKLADFGIARMLDGARLTATNMVPGTAAYLSPEQAAGQQVGPPADIYSLGLVLLEALTGKVEFPGPPLEAAVARLMVLTACSGQPGLDAGTAGELQARVAAAKQLTAKQDFPAALAELQQLGQDVEAAAEQGLMPADRKARAESAINKIRAELEAAQISATPQPAPSAEPAVEEDQKEQEEDAKKEAEKQLEDAKKEAEKAEDKAKGNG